MTEVIKANNIASIIFFEGVVIYFFLKIAILIFTWINKAPRQPQIAPKIIAAGKSCNVLVTVSKLPNLSAPESEILSGLPFDKLYRIEKVNVPNEVEKNTRQSIENVQKVLGLEIS
jgi:hypothetical protein